MQIVDLRAPANKGEKILTEFVQASQKHRADCAVHKNECGELRRSITDMREGLQSMMGNSLQISVPNPGGTPLFCKVKTYRSSKTINENVIKAACEAVLENIDIPAQITEQWKKQVVSSIASHVRGQVVSKKSYVDTDIQSLKAGVVPYTPIVSSGNDAVARVALELYRLKLALKTLTNEYKHSQVEAKKHLEQLKSDAAAILSSRNCDRIRMKTQSADTADLFVTTRKRTVPAKKLTMRKTSQIVAESLERCCHEGRSIHDLIILIRARLKHHMKAESHETYTVTCDRAPTMRR